MLGVDRRSFQNFDWVLFGMMGILVAVGIANLFSATQAGTEVGLPSELRRQLVALGAAVILMLAVVSIDYRRLERLAIPIYLGTLALLVITLVFAQVTRGTRGWLEWGPLRIQTAELAKIGLVLAMARYFHRYPPNETKRLRDLWRPLLIAAAPVGLIVLQPDLGVAVLTLLIAASYLPLVRIPMRSWVGLGVAGMIGLACLWQFALSDYQRGRILDFVDPGRDPLASGYQAIQSRIAVGSGGFLGKGYLEGTQTQLSFLPAQHTDFAFSVLAEEWGFVGSTFVLGVYLGMLLWGLLVARGSRDGFGALLAVGVVGVLFWPAVINVAMVLGLAPVIGVPLPLISYGGSALIVSMIGVGLLLNISMRRYLF
ncbi:MAG: rod shape-determining protein RodA [Myxococcota bacterium]